MCGEDRPSSTESFPLTITCGCGGANATDDTSDSEDAFPLLGADDEADEEREDADATGTDTDYATPSAVVGGATAMFVAAAVSLAFVGA